MNSTKPSTASPVAARLDQVGKDNALPSSRIFTFTGVVTYCDLLAGVA